MVTIRYFAGLREQLGRESDSVDFAATLNSPRAIWVSLHAEEPPPRLMVAVNQQYAALDSPVQDGDEVAFFPPVTGG